MVNKSSRDFKKTDICEVPEHWPVIRLESITTLITKGTTPTTYGFNYEDEGVNFIKVESIDERGNFIVDKFAKISPEAHEKLNRSQVQEGDLLLSIAGVLGRLAIANTAILPVNTNQALAIVRLQDEIDRKFVFYALKSPIVERQIKEVATVGAQPNLSLKQVGDILIPFPPKREQTKIAAILTSFADAIEKTEAIIKQTEVVKKGLLQRLLTKGMGHSAFKQTEIGEIPETWDVVKLNDVTDVRDGTHDSPKYVENGIPFVTSKNLKNGVIDFSDVKYISEEDHFHFQKRSKVDDGDIIFGMIGTIGNPVIVCKEVDFSIKNVALIKFRDASIENRFVYYLLNSPTVQKQLAKASDGGVQKFVSLGTIRNLNIPLPPIAEQRKISDVLDSLEEKIRFEKRKRFSLAQVEQVLMRVLLTDKLVVNLKENYEVVV